MKLILTRKTYRKINKTNLNVCFNYTSYFREMVDSVANYNKIWRPFEKGMEKMKNLHIGLWKNVWEKSK